MTREKKVELHVYISLEQQKKLRVLSFHSTKSLGFIVRKAIDNLRPEDLK